MLAQNDPEGASEESGQPKEAAKKTASKLVRVMTVLAYLMSVSMAAILLSIYYLCIWKSPVLSDLEKPVKPHHLHAESFDYRTGYINNDSVPYNYSGGSSTTINDTDELPPSSVTYPEQHEPSETIDTTVVTEPTQRNSTSVYRYNRTTEAVETDNERTTLT